MLINKTELNVFLITSIISLITLGYLGIAFLNKGRPSSVKYELMVLVIPILYGILGVINYKIINKYGNNSSIILGIFVGLCFSLIGRFILNLPVILFDLTKNNEYRVHIIAMIMYGLIFRFIITPLTNYLIN